MKYCNKCVTPETAETNIFGKDGCEILINGRRQYGKIINISNNGIVRLNLDSEGIQEFDPRKIKILYD